ncbi:MAG TPA: hypothetical protein VG518_08615 [Solirubrobacterales bacterium]|nr:hypothetical protein [Solirubrobacterales bacterium]
MIGTYAATAAICVSALATGQAAIALCGARRWSWLAPAVGLALLCAVCWATVRLPGDGTISALAVLVLTAASLAFHRGRVEGGREALLPGALVAVAGLVAASLPFIAEGHFGILGTGFDPDMSQHLLTADRLAHGQGSQLLTQGYPLGPHSLVVALNKGLGVGLVQGFDGLSVAVAILAPLTALAAFEEKGTLWRAAGALVVGLTYMLASYYAQGAFKEAIQAFLVLAFVLALREAGRNPEWRGRALRFVPAALIAVGSVYVYSYPGLVWLAAAAVVWLVAERLLGDPPAFGDGVLRAGLLALGVLAVLVAPEIGRMVEFHNFETFDPNGPGLGNLFGRIWPLEAFGIWPSGDFRLEPGAGAVPAFGYYLGAGFATVMLAYGAYLCWRRRELALLSGLAAVAGLFAIAHFGGTPYTEAKSIAIAAPVCAVVILVPLLRRPAGVLYMAVAGLCALLAFANAPVGPTEYSPALTEMRPIVADDSTLILAAPKLLEEEQGERYVVWELRGGRVCVEAANPAGKGGSTKPPRGVRFVVTEGGEEPFTGLRIRKEAAPYTLWETIAPPRGKSDCPLIAVRQARQGPAE